MGLEEYTIQLCPTSNENLDTEKLEHTLKFLRFQKLDPTVFIGGAQLAEVPRDEVYFQLCADTYIVEAKMKMIGDSPQSLQYLSLRFALGQPLKVVEDFPEIVCDLTHRFNMIINDAGGTYQCHGLPCNFCSTMDSRIRARKAQWHTMFPGVAEKPRLLVSQAWSHFISERDEAVLHEKFDAITTETESVASESGEPLFNTDEAQYDRIVEEKYRKMGFKL